MKTKIFFLGLLLTVFTISCTKDKDDTASITAEEASINSKIDIANNDVSDIVEEQEANTYANPTTGKSNEVAFSTFSICATITRVPAFGTAVIPGTLVTKTIDFGTSGCALNNGNIVKGKIIINYTYEPQAISHTINYQFVDFYHNSIKYVGNKSFTRTMTANSGSSISHPIVTMDMDITATFPNGNIYTRVGNRTREIVSGYDTPSTWTDNIYQVTGSWTTTFPNTTEQTSTITSPLLIKMSCVSVNKPLIVQGVITFVRNSHTATLDYGNGNCDNLAVFTINGNSYNIVIGN